MAGNAAGAVVVSFVAIDAAAHGCYIRRFGGDLHLAYVSVARLTFQLGLKVRTVAPVDERRHGLDANPRNRLVIFCKLRKLLDGGFVLSDLTMTTHTFRNVWNRHMISRIGICVTELAEQLKGNMDFMTECHRLLGCGGLLLFWGTTGLLRV
jgi:hypothetical protein